MPAPGGAAAAGVIAPGAAALCGVVSFRELSMLWQRHRKHSQRLVLLLDCAHSGYWVAALRMLSKAEQLELSLGVQVGNRSGCGGMRGCAWGSRWRTVMGGGFGEQMTRGGKGGTGERGQVEAPTQREARSVRLQISLGCGCWQGLHVVLRLPSCWNHVHAFRFGMQCAWKGRGAA